MRSKLNELMKERDVKMSQVARATKVNRNLISNIANERQEKIKEIPLAALVELCNYFKRPIQDIIYFEVS